MADPTAHPVDLESLRVDLESHPVDLESLRAGFAEPARSAAPGMRWWWFGPDVEDGELERELRAMAAAGIGGAEIAVVYPLSVTAGRYLDEAFLASLRHAVEYGASLGLRMDLTLGSGWSFGGPHITPDLAARTLAWDRREISPGAHRLPVAAPFPGDELVAAFVGVGSGQEPAAECRPLEITDGHVVVPDGLGPRQVLLAWSRLTGQNVKRAAHGAEGPVLDHYSADAVRTHLAAVGDVLLDAVDPALLGSVFCDSLEVYEANWTPDLPAEFARRRGYDLLPRLVELAPGATAASVRADFHRTLTELYEERFVGEVSAWARSRGVRFRLQGYGVPPASLASYRGVDGIEGEGWGWRTLTSARWAASAAAELGHAVTSAEAWTWVHSPSFRATPLDLAGEAHEHLLAGVNHLVGHGWPYSPPDAPGVGWLFYASGALDDRNAWWPAAPSLFTYLTRLCWLMRQGEPVTDVTVLVPTEDVYAGLGPELDLYRAVRRHIGDDLTATLRTRGWDYVVVDDALALAGRDRVRGAVVVPHATTLPDATRAWLEARAADGVPVVLVGGTLEVAGASRVPDAAALPAELGAFLPPRLVVTGGGDDVGVRHRRVGDADVYFVANTGARRREVRLSFRTPPAHLERWDAHHGTTTPIEAGAPLRLEPYEAAVLVALTEGREGGPEATRSGQAEGVATRVGSEDATEPVDLRTGSERLDDPSAGSTRFPLADWKVTGPGGRRPVEVPHRWEDDAALARFCGTATYSTTFDVEPGPGRVVLDLGPTTPTAAGEAGEAGLRGPSFRAEVEPPVGEVAEVLVNGRSCGVVWCPPYAIDVTAAVHPGRNELELRVSNTSAHALADDETLPDTVAAVTERFGRRFVMQDVAIADAGVSSGLLARPTLRVDRLLGH